jgi:hypothetical protein
MFRSIDIDVMNVIDSKSLVRDAENRVPLFRIPLERRRSMRRAPPATILDKGPSRKGLVRAKGRHGRAAQGL